MEKKKSVWLSLAVQSNNELRKTCLKLLLMLLLLNLHSLLNTAGSYCNKKDIIKLLRQTDITCLNADSFFVGRVRVFVMCVFLNGSVE